VPLYLVALAIRQSRDTVSNSDSVYIGDGYKLGRKDFELIKRVAIQYQHENCLEFANMIWEVRGVSRGCSLELLRHRVGMSILQKSSRYSLKKDLKNEQPFALYYNHNTNWEEIKERASKYIVLSDDEDIQSAQLEQLEILRMAVYSGKPNDYIKALIPDSYKTNFMLQFNLRSFNHFLKLRTDKSAHWEIRKLAYSLYDSLPQDYQDLCIGSLQ